MRGSRALWVSLLVGCGGAEAVSDVASHDAEDPLAADSSQGPSWPAQPLSGGVSVQVDAATGRSEVAQVEIPAGTVNVTLRAIPTWLPGLEPRVCFAFDEVAVAGQTLVPDWESQPPGYACTDCSQRVGVGDRMATAVFPNDGGDMPSGALSFRVRAVDCVTTAPADAESHPELPTAFDVDWRIGTDVPADPKLTIAVGFAPGTVFAGAHDTWSPVSAAAASYFEAIGVRLEVLRLVDLSVPTPSRIRFGPGKMRSINGVFERAIDELTEDQTAPVMPVLIVPCLLRQNSPDDANAEVFAGYAPRVPGGVSSTETADGVWLSVGECPMDHERITQLVDNPSLLGRLLAHELGHALGLYHSDQTAGAHRAETANGNLMRIGVALEDAEPALSFSEKQAEVIRRHPYVSSN